MAEMETAELVKSLERCERRTEALQPSDASTTFLMQNKRIGVSGNFNSKAEAVVIDLEEASRKNWDLSRATAHLETDRRELEG